MPCEKHPGEVIKERCSDCGAPLCPTCLAECIGIGEKTLCPACAPEALRDNIREAEKAKKMASDAAKVSSALMAVGLMTAFMAYNAAEDGMFGATVAIVLFFGLARLSSAWAEIQALRRNSPDTPEARRDLRHESLAKIVVAVLFGAFAAPWTTLRFLTIRQHAEKEIRNSQALLEEYADRAGLS